MASCATTKESVWLSLIISDIRFLPVPEPITIGIDNDGTIYLADNPGINERSKHIDVQYALDNSAESDILEEEIDATETPEEPPAPPSSGLRRAKRKLTRTKPYWLSLSAHSLSARVVLISYKKATTDENLTVNMIVHFAKITL